MSKVAVIDFDSETFRTRNEKVIRALRRAAMEKTPANNVPKEEKMRWHTGEAQEERAAEALDKTAVDVLLAEILCVAFRAEGDDEVSVVTEWESGFDVGSGKAEACMLLTLAGVWDELAGPDTVWCGHNVIGFDLPVLLNRWRRWDIRPPEHFPKYYGKGRWGGRVWDTMLRTPCKNPLGYVGIDDALDAYGVPFAGYSWLGAPMDGSRVGTAYESGQYKVIAEYCASDVALLSDLRNKQTCGGAWGGYDARTAVAEQVALIRKSDQTPEAKALAILNIMEMNGLVPGL